MINKIFKKTMRYLMVIVPAIIFNLLLAAGICFFRDTKTIVQYSNTLLIIGGICAAIGTFTFWGNSFRKDDPNKYMGRSLVSGNMDRVAQDRYEATEKNFNFLLITAIVGIVTVLLSGLVLKFR